VLCSAREQSSPKHISTQVVPQSDMSCRFCLLLWTIWAARVTLGLVAGTCFINEQDYSLGYYLTLAPGVYSKLGICTPCEASYYYCPDYLGTHNPCTACGTSVVTNNKVGFMQLACSIVLDTVCTQISCLCNSGYYWNNSTAACTPCSAGYYNLVTASCVLSCPLCPPCPIGQYSLCSGATNQGCKDCTNAGPLRYYTAVSPGFNNTQCPNTQCTRCGVGQYRLDCDRVSSGACASCTSAKSYEYYTTDGYYNNTCAVQNCSRCSVGQYRPCSAGNTSSCVACTNAGPGRYYTTDGVFSNSCSSSLCSVCGTGTYNNCSGAYPGTCVPCTSAPVGYYYTSSGGVADNCSYAPCTSCLSDQFNPTCAVSGGNSPGVCGPCTRCDASSWYESTCGNGIDTVCKSCICPAGTYEVAPCIPGGGWDASASPPSWLASYPPTCPVCPDCPAGTYTNGGCANGAERICTTCTVCPLSVSRPCTPYADTACALTADCHFNPSTYSDVFKEYSWMTPEDRCVRGKHLTGLNPQACELCPSYLVGNGLWCEACKGYKLAHADRDSCVCQHPSIMNFQGDCYCPNGHGLDENGQCSPCPQDTFNRDDLILLENWWTQTKTCEECPVGQFSQPGSSSCQQCPRYEYRVLGQTGCQSCGDSAFGHADCTVAGQCCEACVASCGVASKPVRCSGQTVSYTCEACDWTLPPDARWTYQCSWECNTGYFANDTICQPCSVVDCPLAYTSSACTVYRDTTCDVPCVNVTMPWANAEWAPNCGWACQTGFTAVSPIYGETRWSCVWDLFVAFGVR
jgi:hypothetical protein